MTGVLLTAFGCQLFKAREWSGVSLLLGVSCLPRAGVLLAGVLLAAVRAGVLFAGVLFAAVRAGVLFGAVRAGVISGTSAVHTLCASHCCWACIWTEFSNCSTPCANRCWALAGVAVRAGAGVIGLVLIGLIQGESVMCCSPSDSPTGCTQIRAHSQHAEHQGENQLRGTILEVLSSFDLTTTTIMQSDNESMSQQIRRGVSGAVESSGDKASGRLNQYEQRARAAEDPTVLWGGKGRGAAVLWGAVGTSIQGCLVAYSWSQVAHSVCSCRTLSSTLAALRHDTMGEAAG